jgi:hypothetical protein
MRGGFWIFSGITQKQPILSQKYENPGKFFRQIAEFFGGMGGQTSPRPGNSGKNWFSNTARVRLFSIRAQSQI